MQFYKTYRYEEQIEKKQYTINMKIITLRSELLSKHERFRHTGWSIKESLNISGVYLFIYLFFILFYLILF